MQFKRSELATYLVKYFSDLKNAPDFTHEDLLQILYDDIVDNMKNSSCPLGNNVLGDMKNAIRSLCNYINEYPCDAYHWNIDDCLRKLLHAIR